MCLVNGHLCLRSNWQLFICIIFYHRNLLGIQLLVQRLREERSHDIQGNDKLKTEYCKKSRYLKSCRIWKRSTTLKLTVKWNKIKRKKKSFYIFLEFTKHFYCTIDYFIFHLQETSGSVFAIVVFIGRLSSGALFMTIQEFYPEDGYDKYLSINIQGLCLLAQSASMDRAISTLRPAG